RKRLAGVGPLDRLPPDAYEPAAYARVYEALFDEAGRALKAGWSVVLDASFIDPSLRELAAAVAEAAGGPFEGVWLTAPPELLERRIRERTGDASEATAETLVMQRGRNLGRMDWLEVDVSGGAGEAARGFTTGRRRG
ncbi:MAG TPA: AAA family ATPase, partial [Phenylobacterium sp.]